MVRTGVGLQPLSILCSVAMRRPKVSGWAKKQNTYAFFIKCTGLCANRNLIEVLQANNTLLMDKEYHEKERSRLHIGNVIRNELMRQGRTANWLAQKLCCDRTNVYKLFNRTTIDTELLLRVSRILDYDFFRLYQEAL